MNMIPRGYRLRQINTITLFSNDQISLMNKSKIINELTELQAHVGRPKKVSQKLKMQLDSYIFFTVPLGVDLGG